MLQMYTDVGGDKCREIGRKFVNDRLVKLMEGVVIDYVQLEDPTYMGKITCSADWEKPLEEILDLEGLSKDEKFFNNCLDFYSLTPRTVGPKRALHDFFSLYRLLKAKKEYKPDLSMEYILFAIIQGELENCKDDPELYKQVQRIPEPGRTQMLEELMADVKDREPETESVPETAERWLASYEDLGGYEMLCFEDTDCLFLDDMDEAEMEDSGFAEGFDMNLKGDEAIVWVEGNGQEFEFTVPAWEME